MPADRKHQQQQLPLNMADTRRSQQQQMSDRKKSHGYASDQPSLLLSGEFKLYYMLFAVIHVISIPVMWNVSSMNNDSWFQFQHLLSDSWIFGSWRQIDNSDLQYSGFRTKIPILAVCLTLHVLLSRWTRFLDLRFQSTAVNYQHLFQIVFSLVFLYVLHGNGLLKILIILSINYMICRSLASVQTPWLMPLVVWLYCISVLYLNDQHSGYKFSHLHQSFAPLDDNNGLMSRWYVTFNITVLRMISYAMDYQWQLEAAADGSDQKLDSKHQTCVQCRQSGDKCDKYRAQRSRLPEEYSYVNYLQYCLYIPLYLAGPIITFNTYRSQLSQRSKKLEFKSTVVYGLRLAGVIMLMETLMHMMYVVAVQKANAWQNLSGLQVAILSVYNLMFVWLKLLIIWRFFRFWALCDGIYPVENMVRCMYDSFSGIDFWRYWHQSYNKWIIRYLYIPLGGSKYRLYNMWVVFTFVAIWHDITFKLLLWGWLICLFIVPEYLCNILGQKYLSHLPYYRHLTAAGYACNVVFMCIANVVGFCVRDYKDIPHLMQKLFVDNPYAILMYFLYAFMIAQVSIEIRRTEALQRLKYDD
ncbi:hypothetical protein MIR68_005622 [Amoeboaphelidium protococcarum]|nr:hypothetical protein MIR68_005622 [Amoeboaphelidium protococcarum]